MSVNPQGMPSSPAAADAERLADLARRVAALERRPAAFTSDGPPTLAAPDGSLCVDEASVPPRLYARSGGVWRHTPLT